jgi:CNT family concentrative nucleoside transporter
MHRTMRTSGAETIATAGSIFFGLMEAPLLVRPYIAAMTRSELFAVMTAGLATVSGGVLLAYVGMLSPFFPEIGAHLISASVMSAPAALAVAKIMLPETEVAATSRALPMESEIHGDVNVIDAAGRGAVEGMFLALKVGAMLIAFLALLAMTNAAFGWIARTLGFGEVTIQAVLGKLISPIAYMVGIPWAEAPVVGELIGVKTILNEFVAFRELAQIMAGPSALSERSAVLTSYALAGFANFGSIAMQIAGIGELAQGKRAQLAEFGIRALIGGALAALMTAAVAGILLP